MKCFEVTINGETICTAGVGDDGVLLSTMSFVKRNEAETQQSESLDLRVGGVANREPGVTEHLEWLHRDLNAQQGDIKRGGFNTTATRTSKEV
jgi:hypothetical protein